jgi:hypothetical protein
VPSASSKTLGTGLLGVGEAVLLRRRVCLTVSLTPLGWLLGIVSSFDVLFLLKPGMLLRASLMERLIAVSPDCAFSSRSISPKMVLPLMARFSSGIGVNLTIPRSGGTLRMSAMKACMSAALRLFVTGCICDGNVVIVRI